MNQWAWTLAAAALFPATLYADAPSPLSLDQSDYQSIYAPPDVGAEDTGINEGGLNVDLTVSYFTDYIWRGIDRSESGGAEDAPNLQFDGALKWDLGKWPHPFIGVFTNVYDSDPLSRFQEVRPYFGLELNARPITFTVGHSNYIYPERDQFNTAELWAKIKVDDSYFFHTDDPVLSPYVFAAYDYDVNHGLYVEAGVSHDFRIEETGLTLTPSASVAYVDNYVQFRRVAPGTTDTDPAFDVGSYGSDTGFQHYQVGLEATYGLNELLNLPARYGKFNLKGYLFYTDGLKNNLRAATELYGGVGISFSY